MTKAFLLALACLGILIPIAGAVDWKARTSLTETFEANDNRRLAVNPLGDSYNTISRLLLDATALAPTWSLNVNSLLTYRTFSGPGELGVLPAFDKAVNGTFVKSEKLGSYNLAAGWSQIDLNTTQLAETGLAQGNGTILNQRLGGGFKHELTPRDTFAWQTTYSTTQTTPAGNTATATPSPSNSFASLLGIADLNHRLSPSITLKPSLQLQYLNYDNAAQTEILFWQPKMGVSVDLSKNVFVTGSFGGAFINSKNNGGGAINQVTPDGLPAGPGITAASSADWVGNFLLTYKMTPSATVTLTAAQSIAPSSLGQFFKNDTVGLAMNYSINQASHLIFSGSFTQQQSSSGVFDIISASAIYSARLSREWSTQLIYRYTDRITGSSTQADTFGTVLQPNIAGVTVPTGAVNSASAARSNAVLVSLTRDVTIVP